MRQFLIFACLLLSLLMIDIAFAAGDTGFDAVMDGYGFNLISYDITDKFTFSEEKFVCLEIVIERNDQYRTLYWIMKKERYNELKEKI